MRKFPLIIKIEEQQERRYLQSEVGRVEVQNCRYSGWRRERCLSAAVRCGHIKAPTDCWALASTFHVCVNNPTGTHAHPCETGIRFRSNRCPFSMPICVHQCVYVFMWSATRVGSILIYQHCSLNMPIRQIEPILDHKLLLLFSKMWHSKKKKNDCKLLFETQRKIVCFI